MLFWVAVFFVIALLAAVFGFGVIAVAPVAAVGVAKFLFMIFFFLALICLWMDP